VVYPGHLRGPRESEIVDRLGFNYFGISPAHLEYDIEMWQESERLSEVQSVHVDDNRQPCIFLSKGKIEPARFHLARQLFRGWTKTFTKEGAEHWRRRSEQASDNV
jgi:hypothetical protein